MKWRKWFLIFIGVCLLGSVAVPRYLPGSLRPDVFVIIMVFAAVRAPARQAIALCWLTGLGKDLMSGTSLGAYALLYLLTGLAIIRFRTAANVRLAVTRAAIGFLAALAIESVYLAAAAVRTGDWPTARTASVLVTASLVTGVSTAACAWLLDRVGGWLGIRRRRHFVTG